MSLGVVLLQRKQKVVWEDMYVFFLPKSGANAPGLLTLVFLVTLIGEHTA